MLTNGQGAQQRAKLAAIGLTDPRLVVCVSEELPAAKPAAAAYEAACAALGLAPDQVLMVGDHRTNDVDGARAAGLHAVHISANPAPRPTTDHPEEVETIASVADLRLRLARFRACDRGRGRSDRGPMSKRRRAPRLTRS